MANDNHEKIEELARKGEAILSDALAKADDLLVKTASLRHQVNKLKDELAQELAQKGNQKQGV